MLIKKKIDFIILKFFILSIFLSLIWIFHNPFNFLNIFFIIFSFIPILIIFILNGFTLKNIEYRLYKKYSFFRKTIEKIKPWIKNMILSSMFLKDPEKETSILCLNLFFSLFYIPIILIYSFYELFFLIFLIIIFIPIIKTYFIFFDKIRERKERIDSEIPFFTFFSSIVSRSGISLYQAFIKSIKIPEIFKQFSKEGAFIRRDIEYLGYGVLEGLEKNALNNPCEEFKRLVLSVTSVWRSGGDIATTLENKAEEYIEILEDKWENFSEQISNLGETLGIIFLGFSIGIISIGIAFPYLSINLLNLFAGIIIPILTFIAFIIIRNVTPRTYNNYDFSKKNLLTFFSIIIISFIFLLEIKLPFPLIIAIIISIFSIIIQLIMYKQILEIKSAEDVLQRFARDVTEYKKIGNNIIEAIKKCSKYNNYNSSFNNFLKKVVNRFKLGLNIYEAGKIHRNWLVRILFFLFNEVEESGGSPYLLEKIIELFRRYHISKKKAINKIKLYFLISFSSPFLILFICALMLAVLSGTGLESLRIGSFSIATSNQMKQIINISMIIAIEVSVSLSFLLNRAIEGDCFTTYRIFFTCLIFIFSYIIFPYLTKYIENLLIGSNEIGAAFP